MRKNSELKYSHNQREKSMMTVFKYLAILLLLVLMQPAIAQIRVSGSLQSSLYSLETQPAGSQSNFYQGMQLKVSPAGNPDVYLSTYFRVAKVKDVDWDEQFYNLYLNWKIAKKRLQFRLGRQFLYDGVINGTMDGLLVTVQPTQKLNLKAFAGLETPFNRDFQTVNSDSNAIGGYASYRFSRGFNANVSYFRRERNDQTVWQIIGAALHGVYKDNLYYQAQIDHNLESGEIQGMRYRLNYYYQNWSFSGEFNNQKPRIFEDSFFRIFEQEAFNQIRGGVTYRINQYQVGLQYLLTSYEKDETHQLIANLGNRWGLVGLVFQDGYAGDNIGIYGDVRYPVIPQLTVKLYSSYYNFQRHLVEIDENATAFSGGFDFRPVKFLSIQAEVQESINSFYDNDLRGLFRLLYFFKK